MLTVHTSCVIVLRFQCLLKFSQLDLGNFQNLNFHQIHSGLLLNFI